MVHVISAHHFGGQEVVTIDHPLAITTGPDNILFVSTPDHNLHILDIANGEPLKPPFSTVDAAISICYSRHGDYVATLEAKEARHSPDFSYIRVYRHWAEPERAQPMRARIAARVTPSSSGADAVLEMIEVPINEHATAIACCQRTGNLAVACGTLVTLHQFVLKTHDISKFQFCDLEEIVQLELPFEVTELALCEELLVCAGSDQLQVLQLTGTEEQSSPASPSQPPECTEQEQEEEELQQVVWDPVVPEQSRGLPALRPALRLQLPALHRPLLTAADPGPAPRLLPAAGRLPLAASSLLYWRETDGETLVPGALCVTPFYDRAEQLPNDSSQGGADSCLHSADRALLAAVSLFFSSTHEGRLYQVAPLSVSSGRQRPCAALVGTHTYTSPLLLAARQHHMLHALTHTGLESYTVRDTRRLCLQQRPQEPCPDWTDAGFMLGLQPFVGVTHLCVGDGVLALAASDPELSDSATLYLLRLPPALQLSRECARLASTHGQHSPSRAMCLALLEEAHMVLRPAVSWQQDRPPTDQLLDEFARSAANIGCFLLRSPSDQDWARAVPWLRLASATVEQVLSKCAESPGLDSYLSSALADPTQPPLSYQTANRALSVLSGRAPEAVAPALLLAGPLAEFACEPPLEALLQLLEAGQLSEPAAQAARLAALLLLARAGGDQAERSQPLLEGLSEDALPAGEPHLLLAEGGGRRRLTALAELLAAGRPDLLAAALAALPGLPELTALLLEAADTADRRAALRYELLLRDVLERRLQSGARPHGAGQAVTLLVRMYLGGTVGAFPPPSPPAGAAPTLPRHRLGALYGPRAGWLNLLPPFVGRTPTQILADMEADRRLVDLVMLQSLLCSGLPSAEDRRNIGHFLAAHPAAVGRDALQALCSEIGPATEIVAAKYPEAALEHAKERCSSPAEWRAALAALSAAPGGGQQSALAALLDHLAASLPPDQLREALPDLQQHQAALLRCHNVQRADVVMAEIMRMA